MPLFWRLPLVRFRSPIYFARVIPLEPPLTQVFVKFSASRFDPDSHESLGESILLSLEDANDPRGEWEYVPERGAFWAKIPVPFLARLCVHPDLLSLERIVHEEDAWEDR